MKDNYGIKDNDRAVEARINALYEELGKRERYAAYEEGVYERIAGLIETSPEEGIDVGAGKGGETAEGGVQAVFRQGLQLEGRSNEALAVGRRCAEVRHPVLVSSHTRLRRSFPCSVLDR